MERGEGKGSLCDIFIKRPIATLLLTVSLIFFGIFCYKGLPVSELPKVDYPVINVSAGFPGMSPTVVASSIATPLEKEFMEISGLKEVTSSSSQGNASITLTFELGKSIDVAAMDVQGAITRAQGKLPSDMPSPPTYRKLDPNSDPIFYIGLVSNMITQGELYDYAKTNIAQQLTRADGVSQVEVYGAPRAVKINLDLRKLHALKISIDDVIGAIKANSFVISTGKLKGKTSNLTITTDSQLETAESYSKVVVKKAANGLVYLGDIARCEDTLASEGFLMTFWGKNLPDFDASLVLAVKQSPGANTVEVAKRVNSMLPQLMACMPKSITMVPMYDKSKTIVSSINEVKESIFIAFLLVSIVIFLFLGRARETLVPVVAMPLSLLLTFVVMKFLGYSLDNLSLMALTLSIGFLVDDAIVFMENVVRHMEDGMGPLEATFKGAKEISFTIVSMTVALMATFLPIVFMDGQVGMVFREFSITIIVAILASGIVSLTVTPVMCAKFLKKHKKNEKATIIERISSGLEKAFLTWYEKHLGWFLKNRWLSYWVWALCFIMTVLLFIKIPKTFLPAGDSSVIFGMFLAKSGTAPEKMQNYQKQIRAIVAKHPSVNYSLTVSGFGSSNTGFVVTMLKPQKERVSIAGNKDLCIENIAQELQGMLLRVPGIWPLVKPMPVLDIQTTSADTRRGKHFFSISGLDPDRVNDLAEKFKQRMFGVKGVIPFSVNSDVDISEPELQMSYNRSRMFQFNVSPYIIANNLKAAYSMNYAYIIKGAYDQYDVIVCAESWQRTNDTDVGLLGITNATGDVIHIDSLLSMKKGLGPTTVVHKNNLPTASVFFNTAPGVPLDFVISQINTIAKELIPADVVGEIGGESKEFKATVINLTILLIIAFFVMYVVMGVLYEHLLHPLTVLSTLPIAMAGGLMTLYMLDQEFSLYGFIGLFMLMGIIKKNGIILVDFAVEKERAGISSIDAVTQACMERFRPILMTTVSTVFGVLPIALGWGADGASRAPLGMSVVGGLIFAQILTLFVTPCIYLLLTEKKLNNSKSNA